MKLSYGDSRPRSRPEGTCGAFREPRLESLATEGGGWPRPGWARSIAPGRGDPRCASCFGGLGGLRSGPRLHSLLQMPKQLLKLPFPGVGARLERGRHNAFPARTKGARRAPRPFPFNFPPLLKEKLTPRRLGEPDCVGAAEGTFPFPPERRGSAGGRLSSAAGTPGAPPSPPGGHSPDF